MKKGWILYFVIFIVLFFSNIATLAEKLPKQDYRTLRPIFTSQEPVLDGKLDDEVWKREPDVGDNDEFISYSPVNGTKLPYKTHVWLAYDHENLYFAFYCYDDEPDKIKTSVTKRDNMWSDDWIGFDIDTIGNKRIGYVLCVNPHGVQGDLYDSSTTVDDAPDYIWYSKGRIVDDGYIIEMKIPLRSFKYKSGKNVKMNIIFERGLTRAGLMGSWPHRPVGQPFSAGMTKVIYGELKSQPRFEAIPTVTYSNFWDRESPDAWSQGDDSTDIGVTAKYTLSSTIAGEATLNPDFSQVESDAFQILVNQRYPIFYTEKRPFFMETANRFSIAGSNLEGANLIAAVHTRNIVDPFWGVKLEGDLKNYSFGLLAAGDEWPGRTFSEPGQNPFEDKKALFVIGRAKVGLGRDTHFGIIFNNRNFADGYNRAIGGDLYYRFGGGNHFIRSHYIYTDTKDESTLEKTSGSGLTLSYEYHTRPFDLMTSYEYFGQDFNMATAFLRRIGISKGAASLGINFYPSKKVSWIRKISPYVFGFYLHDTITREDDYLIKGGIKFNFIKKGSFKLEFQTFSEFWKGETFKGNFFDTSGGVQLTNWLNLYAYLQVGDSIYYDAPVPLLGNGLWFDFQATIQPNDKISQFFQYQYQELEEKTNGEKLYDINILISHTTYQISRYLFLRAIFQYDSFLETLLTDALVSFELIPGTVLQLGYGSLHKKLRWLDNGWINTGPQRYLYQTNQSLFFKAGYLLKF